MPTVSLTLPNDGDNADASDVNTPFNQLANVINGHIDADNIEPGSLTWAVMDTITGDIPPEAMEDSGNLNTFKDESMFDHVVSGGVWTGDSYGSTRAASMTAIVAVVSGKRVTASAVTARTFTASRDTYVSISDTGALAYSEVTNNAASPTLPANSMWVAIIVTGASSIASVASINQGQEDKVLPIASSTPYTVTDSNGNLICNRDPNSKLLGFRQIISSFTPGSDSTSAVDVTGLSLTVIVPTGRKIKVTGYCPAVSTSSAAAASNLGLLIQEGATVFCNALSTVTSSSHFQEIKPFAIKTLSAGAHTLKIAAQQSGASGRVTVGASAANPAHITVELL